MYSNSQQVGNPTYCGDVVECIFYLLSSEISFGLYNGVNEGPMSRYEYVKNIVAAYGLSVRVEPVEAKRFQRLAPVSITKQFLNTNLKNAIFICLAH